MPLPYGQKQTLHPPPLHQPSTQTETAINATSIYFHTP